MNTPNDVRVKRILVAIDTSPRSLAPLQMAVDLAAHLQAELETLFVEDTSLLHLAELPFATELDRASGEARALNAPSLTYALQSHAQRLRQLLRTVSEEKQVQTNLRVVRGNYVAEAMHAEADVLFMFTSKRVSVAPSGRAPKPTRARPMIWDAAPIYVYYTGGLESERALALAADLAGMLGIEVVVLLPAGGGQTISIRKKRSSELLGGKRPVRYELVDSDLAGCAKKLATTDCTLLVMPKHDATTQLAEMRELEAIHCPLVLVA
ncbi:MAG: universal stress protein [Gammaproteobacteria bacterium]|nr:universal stress protein [Gammaproteobacteria bacterium]MDH3467347.1 universal stress protein [Gammaproteobacteria bacterium]